MNMNSFYGGPNGQSFSISYEFGNKVELDDDLGLGWESSIHVGEFVIISYGRAGSPEYSSNLIKDNNISWNSTLWQKVYNEATMTDKDIQNVSGFAYRWIAHMVGNTPVLSIQKPDREDLPADPEILVLDADEKPNAWIDTTNVDQPILYVALPRSQVLKLKEFTFLDANGTPEVKIDETDINNPGLIIKLPRAKGVSVDSSVTELDNNQSPSVDLSASTVNETIVKFELPQAKKITIDPIVESLDNGSMPQISLDGSTVNEDKLKFKLPKSKEIEIDRTVEVLDVDKPPAIDTTGSDVNVDKIKFQLPQSQRIKAVQIEEINNGDSPTVELIIDEESYSINEPLLKFKVPCIQRFIEDNISSITVGANVDPSVTFDSNGNEPKLVFSLPKSQIFQVNDIINILGPQGQPNVTLSYDDLDIEQNNPILTFDLPRAVKFYYGTMITGTGIVNAAYSDFDKYEVGDYYINSNTGEVYSIILIDKENDAIAFQYQACLQAPMPKPGVTGVNPYSDTMGTLTTPTVQSKLDTDGKILWDFGIPLAPNIIASITPLGAGEWSQTSVQRFIESDGATIRFDFRIPKGTQLTAGNNIPTSGTNVQIGDLYLHLPTGIMYEWNGTTWVAKPNSLQGPAGDALKIRASFDDTSTPPIPNIENDTDANIGATYIKSQISAPFKQDELFALTYNNITYWYYCIDSDNDIWSRAQLTGNISDAIKEVYTTDANKIYSAQYINSLINKDANLKDRTTYSKEVIDERNSWGSWDVNGNLKDGNGNLIT